MNLGLFLLGVLAWAGVVALSIGMAAWEEPVLGFFPYRHSGRCRLGHR